MPRRLEEFRQEILGKKAVEEVVIPDAQLVDLDTATEEELLMLSTAEYTNTVHLDVVRAEIIHLATFYADMLRRIPENERQCPENFQKYVLRQLVQDLPNEEREQEYQRLNMIYDSYQFIFQDVLAFADAVINEASQLPDQTSFRYCFCYPSKTGQSILMPTVGETAWSLLRRSRLLGLVPFATLDKLEEIKIACVGASVAAQAIELLVDYGVKNLSLADPGHIDPSNSPRLPGRLGEVDSLGQLKVKLLQRYLMMRNPWTHIVAEPRAVVPGEVTESEKDIIISIKEFAKDASIVIEVIDSPEGKIGLRLEYGDRAVFVFLADTSPIPLAGVEEIGGNLFNQALSTDNWAEMYQELIAADNPILKATLGLHSILTLLDKDIPERHLAITALNALFLHPFLSQEPADAKMNAALLVRLIIEMIENDSIQGQTFSMGDLQQRYLQQEVDRAKLFLRIKQLLEATIQTFINSRNEVPDPDITS